jgi:hypothetical protein
MYYKTTYNRICYAGRFGRVYVGLLLGDNRMNSPLTRHNNDAPAADAT